ncbi:MAG: bifunctional hydroxymethylpyrimidine kinase/phosphomethylpyrimidine kinase [Thermodesulfovibrionales bacterium]|nr:bifunctional hydroxymethylpyrimidine kinase/phosphomethylpyrimidine kinase [Thermodesulfovibrionales bacterium]
MKKKSPKKTKICLTIAGFDPSGGAGIQSDIKVFKRLGCYGLSVATTLTIQNTQGVFVVHPIKGEIIYRQLKHLIQDINIDAIKIGMLYSSDVVNAVSDFLSECHVKIVVLDTPIISSSGMPLINKSAIGLLKKQLMPKATVITPNIPEAEILTGIEINNLQDMKDCASCLHDLGAENVVIKGGHFKHADKKTIDVVFDGSSFEMIRGNLYAGEYHGTGCAYSSGLTAYLCKDIPIFDAARKARHLVVSAIKSHIKIGLGMGILDI